MHSDNTNTPALGAPKKDTSTRNLRLTNRVNRAIDRIAHERGISFSDVINLTLHALGTGEPLPFPFSLEK